MRGKNRLRLSAVVFATLLGGASLHVLAASNQIIEGSDPNDTSNQVIAAQHTEWNAKGRAVQDGKAVYTLSDDVSLTALDPKAKDVYIARGEKRNTVLAPIVMYAGDTTINLNGHQLNVIAGPGKGSWESYGRPNLFTAGIALTAGDLTVEQANGIHVSYDEKDGDTARYGIYVVKGSHLHIKNDTNSESAVTVVGGTAGKKAKRRSHAVYVAGENSGLRPTLTVDGQVNIDSGKGQNPVYVELAEATIGGGIVNVHENGGVALTAHRGTIHFGKEGISSQITGDVRTTNKPSLLDLKLTTQDSFLKGRIIGKEYITNAGYGSYGESDARLTLSNGAHWDNQSVGGTNWDALEDAPQYPAYTLLTQLNGSKGHIYQNDPHDISVKKMSGDVTVHYARKEGTKGAADEDYLGGRISIESADPNSSIVLLTSPDQLNLSDDHEVSTTLNTLAGKLTYAEGANGITNLSASAGIGEGLLTPSVTVSNKKAITFDPQGKGTVAIPPEQPKEKTWNRTITEGVFQLGAEDIPGIQEAWINDGIRTGEGKYVFNVNTTIETRESSVKEKVDKLYGIIQGKNDKGKTGNIEIDMNGHNLTLRPISKSLHYGQGIYMKGSNLTMKNVGDMSIELGGFVSESTKIHGINIVAMNGHNANMVIENEGKILTVKNGASDTGGDNSSHGRVENIMRLVSDGGIPSADIKGLIDFQAGNKTGIQVETAGTVRIGGGKITTTGNAIEYKRYFDDSEAGVYMNANVEGGSVSEVAEDKTVQIKGNVDFGRRGGNFSNSIVALGFVTPESFMDGRFVNANKAKVYMVLKNGATWKNGEGSHVAQLVGGDAGKAGVIVVKSSGETQVDTYSGNTMVIYEHEAAAPSDPNEGLTIKGGNFKIGTAEANSGITLRTDNTGLNTSSDKAADKNLVSGTLNKLANKLFYTANDGHLSGKVEIAEGLTSASASSRMEDMTFKAEKGQGQYVYTPAEDVVENPPFEGTSNVQIVEDFNYGQDNREYWSKQGNVYDKDGHYTFDKDVTLNIDQTSPYRVGVWGTIVKSDGQDGQLRFGAIQWKRDDKTGTVDMQNHKLTLNSSMPFLHPESPVGIVVHSGTLTMKNVGGIDLNVAGGQHGMGIHVNGTRTKDNGSGFVAGEGKAELIIENDLKPENAVKIRVEDSYHNYGGIFVNRNSSGHALLDIKGLVDVDVNDNEAVLSWGRTYIGGGKIKSTGSVALGVGFAGQLWVNAERGTNNEAQLKNKTASVQIDGDSYSEGGSELLIGLGTADSYIDGVIVTDKTGMNQSTHTWGVNPGRAALYMGKNTKWTNHQVGHGVYSTSFEIVNGEWSWHGTDIPTPGSHLQQLVAEGANIYQKHEKALTIDQFRGDVNLFYEHTGDGTKVSDYAAGDTHIKSAAADSNIVVITDNTGVVSDDGAKVLQTLNALAGKVYYDNYATTGEQNLKGKAKIAEGLTAASAEVNLGDIVFKKDNGQGTVEKLDKEVQPNPDPGPNPNPGPNPDPKLDLAIEYGDQETMMMRGSKSAMASAMVMWRNGNNDLQKRMGDIRLSSASSGIWAKYFGGKNTLDDQKANIKQDYNFAQVGYDKKVGDWHMGVALDYGTANDTYLNGSKGDPEMISFALYGSKQQADGTYFDVIAKGSHLKNKYTILGQMDHHLKGDYKTWGGALTVEYGKRMEQENGFYFEPSVSFTAGRLAGKTYDATSDYKNPDGSAQMLHIHQSGVTTAIGRIGVSVGKQTSVSNMFAKLGLAHEFAGDLRSTFLADGDKEAKEAKISLQDSWLDLEVGGSYLLNKDTYLYGVFSKNFGATAETDWRVDAGIRFSF